MNPVIVALAAATAQAAPQFHAPPAEVAGAEVRAVEVTSDGSVWLGVRDRGLARIRGGSVDWVTEGDGLFSNGVAYLTEDSRGRLWATGFGGFSVFDGSGWSSRRQVGHLAPRVVFGVSEDLRSDAIWFGTSSGAARLSDDVWSFLDQTAGLPHSVVHAVVVDPAGGTWFACRTGLARSVEGQVSIHFQDVNFRSALLDSDGRVWFGTSNGVYRWDGAGWNHTLQGTVAYPRLESRDGTIWAGSAGAGVLRHGPGGWERIELPGALRGAEVFDLAEAADGSIWIATSAGAVRYDPS